MKFLAAIVLIVLAGCLAFGSVIVGALMLTSANGPTRENWIAHYALTYFLPAAIIIGAVALLVRMFR